jgi:deoxycytidylate deaminase
VTKCWRDEAAARLTLFLPSLFFLLHFQVVDEPIIDLQSDHYFMGEALRQAAKAYAAEEVPVGAVIVREGRIIARAFNQVELLKDATAHA